MSCMCDFPAGCGGLGVLHCAGCGGDLCICTCGGETDCDGCDDCEGGEGETFYDDGYADDAGGDDV